MITLKQIRITCQSLLILFLIYCTYIFIIDKMTPDIRQCGKVISKSNNDVVIKNGNRTELYLNVQFENLEFKSILVDPTTYFKYDINDSVCFSFNVYANIPFILICNNIGLITVIIICVLSFLAFVAFILGWNFKFEIEVEVED